MAPTFRVVARVVAAPAAMSRWSEAGCISMRSVETIKSDGVFIVIDVLLVTIPNTCQKIAWLPIIVTSIGIIVCHGLVIFLVEDIVDVEGCGPVLV